MFREDYAMLRLIAKTPRRTGRSAFTLLEVLVVVSIIVVLVGLGTVYVFRYLDDANIDASRVKATKLAQTLSLYNQRIGQYPDNLNALVQPPDGGKPFCAPEEIVDAWNQTFQFDPAGPHNNGLRPDVWTVKDGVQIGNWK